MSSLLQDLRYGARMLLKHPGFTLVAVVALALGVGANTAIFSVVNALLLRPLAGVAEPEQLVMLGKSTGSDEGISIISYPDSTNFRDQSTTFSGIATYFRVPLHLSTGQESERAEGALVSGNYFTVLGVKATRGRTLLPDDDRAPGANTVAVISAGLWRQRFGADPEIVGKAVTLNAHSYTIVGVAAEGFAGTQVGAPIAVWVPVSMYKQVEPTAANSSENYLTNSYLLWLNAFGRLKPGVSIEQARAELTTIARRLHPENKEVEVGVVAVLGLGTLDRASIRRFIGLLIGAAAVVLAVACANVANLLLARATVRRKEIGIRLTLGASRARIVQQLLIESVLLALLGSVAGVFLVFWLNDLLLAFLPPHIGGVPIALDLSLDRRVLTFTLVVSLLTGILVGLAPALQTFKSDLVSMTKDVGTIGQRVSRVSLRGVLITVQVAASLVLLIGAGLLVNTLLHARAIDLGFNPERVLTASIDLGRQNYTEEQGRLFYQQLIERVAGLPGVQSASLAQLVPLGRDWPTSIWLERAPGNRSVTVSVNTITPHYLETMGIQLAAGRDFTRADNDGSANVMIINETLARRLWPNENPLGKRFKIGLEWNPEPWFEVIGTVKDAKYRTLFGSPGNHVYVPVSQRYYPEMTLHLRTSGKPEALAAAVQNEVKSLNKNLPVFNVGALSSQLDVALIPQRLAATLIGGFGLLAAALASIGLYGQMAYTVAQRTREIGIRMALGARTSDVLKIVVRQGMALALIGVAVGLIAASALTRVMASLLYGVSATDPLTFVGVALLLTAVALVACYVPARRATKVDPMVALRYE